MAVQNTTSEEMQSSSKLTSSLIDAQEWRNLIHYRCFANFTFAKSKYENINVENTWNKVAQEASLLKTMETLSFNSKDTMIEPHEHYVEPSKVKVLRKTKLPSSILDWREDSTSVLIRDLRICGGKKKKRFVPETSDITLQDMAFLWLFLISSTSSHLLPVLSANPLSKLILLCSSLQLISFNFFISDKTSNWMSNGMSCLKNYLFGVFISLALHKTIHVCGIEISSPFSF